MRIAMTTDSVGGVWRYAADLGSELAGRGADVTLVGFGPAPASAQVEEVAAAGLGLVWLDQELDWAVADYDALCRTGRGLAAEIRTLRPDICHVNSPALLPFLDAGMVRVAAAHSCLATWWRAMREAPFPDGWMWHYEATSLGLASADAVVAPSGAFAEAVQSAYGRIPGLTVVHNSVLPIRGQAKEGFVLSAGRWWDEAKNMAALDAAAAVSHYPVLAAGPLRGPGAEVAEPDAVTWLGDLPHGELRQVLSRARVFASLSLYEPFGLAVLEAATAGAALVLSDIPTFRELWGSCAVFVDPRDPEAVAATFDRVCGDPNLAAWMGTAARLRSREYTRQRQGEALTAVYDSLLDHAVAV